LKYYPLSLKIAMASGNPLAFASKLETTLCTGEKKPYGECTTWELLNLTPNEVLDLPARLTSQFRIPTRTLEKVLEVYSVQTVGKGKLDLDFDIAEPPQYFISPANHYSWGKSSAITGIGRQNLIAVDIDVDARMDTRDLRRRLDICLRRKQAVYAVVVIVGSTEHGTVDPLSEVLEVRREYQEKGLSFMIHADAAWGGYFTTKTIRSHGPTATGPNMASYAFSLPLSEYTSTQLHHLRFVDSITIDAHKSGYIPYPAGGLCYRDGRLRFLVTWTSPVLSLGPSNDGGMGVYGVEGRFVPYPVLDSKIAEIIITHFSKPGAAAAAVWLSHRVIGLDANGYGNLLGTAILTSVKVCCKMPPTFVH
jgi:glutamate/tyrosine decarboxylase-like PLP-dependent enzyme